jgi:hypothetical protein
VVHRRGARRVPSVRLVAEALQAVDPAAHGLRAASAPPGSSAAPGPPAAAGSSASTAARPGAIPGAVGGAS